MSRSAQRSESSDASFISRAVRLTSSCACATTLVKSSNSSLSAAYLQQERTDIPGHAAYALQHRDVTQNSSDGSGVLSAVTLPRMDRRSRDAPALTTTATTRRTASVEA
ncbi:hypothetical protein MTO96_015395 [Rhipicephalus appendiculatus]